MRAGAASMTRCTAPTRCRRPMAPRAARGFNPARGAKVVARAKQVLDQAAPLATGSHAGRDRLRGARRRPRRSPPPPAAPASPTRRSSPATAATPAAPSAILLRHHGIHIEIRHRPPATRSARPTRPASPTSCSNPRSPRSRTSRTASPRWTRPTRSVVYRNWLGLMKGDLSASFEKDGKTLTRRPRTGPRLHRARTAARWSCPAAA